MRVSTAYQFYCAVKSSLRFIPKCYDHAPKPPFEATGYELFYYAANEIDEAGKTDVMVTLNRAEMWDSNELHGCSQCYEFVGMAPLPDSNESHIGKRAFPCACENCLRDDYDACTNSHIVGHAKTNLI